MSDLSLIDFKHIFKDKFYHFDQIKNLINDIDKESFLDCQSILY
jgi:hypothetical protein